MLYILGGVPRVGKTIIAQAFLERTHIPFLSLDLFKMALVKGLPQAGVDPNDASDVVAKQIWPAVRGLCTTILENKRDHLIEGDSILPVHASHLSATFPGQVRACFLGIERANPANRLATIREHPGPEDWLSEYDDDEVLRMIDEMIEFSSVLRSQAEESGFPYLESRGEYGAFRERVLKFLVTGDLEGNDRAP